MKTPWVRYEIWHDNGMGGTPYLALNVTDSEDTLVLPLTNLEPARMYTFRVRTVTKSGASPYTILPGWTWGLNEFENCTQER